MCKRTDYEAIVFDVGGTLLNVVRDPQEMAVEAVAHLGSVAVAGYAAGIRQAVNEWRFGGGRPEDEDLPETWVKHNRRALALAGFSGDIEAAAQIMEDTFLADGLDVYPDVADALAMLTHGGFKMGIVSNWPATLEKTLDRVGLGDAFAVTIASAKVGYAKPHPRIFHIATEQLGVESERALYIGDSIEHDVIGANAAGMDAVLLDRDGKHDAHSPRIQSLSQLPALLELGS